VKTLKIVNYIIVSSSTYPHPTITFVSHLFHNITIDE